MVNFLRKNIWLPITLLLALGTGFITLYTSNTVKFPDTREDAVKIYLDAMAKGKFDKSLQIFTSGAVGNNPSVENTGIPLEEAERNGLLKNVKVDHVSILKKQRDFVINLFDKDAWTNATYTIQEVKSPEVKEQWVEKSSGKVISEIDGRRKLKEYWDNIGVKENINPKDIFISVPKEKNGEVRDSKQLKLLEIKEKYTKDEPVEIQLIPYYEACEVKFKFNGTPAAASGEYDFRLTLSNKSGKWLLHDGLNWTMPEVEPKGDI